MDPFGGPVVPDVYTKKAMSSSSMASKCSSTQVGWESYSVLPISRKSANFINFGWS